MTGPVNRFTLPNGLRVVHRQDSTTAMVALNLLYDTGARDEDAGLTGMAHLIEHLMFGGSRNVSDFDGELQRAGGISNAWTGNDFTNFYEILPAVNAETAFWVESDRMISPLFTPEILETQRSVVIEEFKQQCLNRPYGDMSHHLRALAYKEHPYRWPVIGLTPEHIERVTGDDVRQFFERRYSVTNSVLAVTGNITPERCRELCDRYMADIEPRRVAPRTYGAEPPITSTRTERVEADVPQRAITIAYPMERYGTPGYYAADAITDVLANGKSARFHRNLLTGTDLFSEVDASITGSEEPGLLMVNARLRRDTPDDEARAIEAIDRELDRLTRDVVTEHELERAKNKYEAQYTYGNIHYARQAQHLAMAEMHSESPGETVHRYRALTCDDVAATARDILRPDARVILSYGKG